MSTHPLLKPSIRAAERVVGRARLAKFARLLTNEVRRDRPNEIDSNGEQLVQRIARTSPDPVVFDVGTHFGEWTESLLSQPGSHPVVHGFEPSASTIAEARKTLAGRATVHHMGLSDAPRRADLHILKEGAGSNSVVPFADPGRHATGQTESIELSTVDLMAEQLGIKQVTLLKIDAEGHDLAVIQGARRLMERQAVGLIQFEYNHRWIDARRFLLDAFEELIPHGYQLGKITPGGIERYPSWHFELETFREANYLAWAPAWSDRLPFIEWWGP